MFDLGERLSILKCVVKELWIKQKTIELSKDKVLPAIFVVKSFVIYTDLMSRGFPKNLLLFLFKVHNYVIGI